MCRKMNGLPVIYMSRKSISERGVQVRGRRRRRRTAGFRGV